jgi:hypothetical protein
LEAEDGRRHSYIFMESDFSMPFSYRRLCEGVVGMPVLRRSMENWSGPVDGVMAVVRGGFELRWRPRKKEPAPHHSARVGRCCSHRRPHHRTHPVDQSTKRYVVTKRHEEASLAAR